MSTIEEIEKRRTARREAHGEKYREQLAKDLEALDAIEDEHGLGQVVRIVIDEERFYPGLVTMAIFRMPSGNEAKRFKDQVRTRSDGKPRDTLAAAELVAHSCLLYPDRDAYKALAEHFSFVTTNASVACIKAAEGREAEEGKD